MNRFSLLRARINPWIKYGQELGGRYIDHRGGLAAGGIAYYTLLAIAPTVYAVGVIGSLFLSPVALDRAFDSLARLAPSLFDPDGSIESSLVSILNSTSGQVLTIQTIIAFAIALFSASNLVVSMRTGLDAALGVKLSKRGVAVRPVATLAALIGVLSIVTIATILVVVPRIAAEFQAYQSVATQYGINWVVVFLILTLLIHALYKYGPHVGKKNNVPIKYFSWGVWLAAFWVVAVTWALENYVLNAGSLNTALLVFGAPIVLLVWTYASTMGLLLGIEIEAMRLEKHGWKFDNAISSTQQQQHDEEPTPDPQ